MANFFQTSNFHISFDTFSWLDANTFHGHSFKLATHLKLIHLILEVPHHPWLPFDSISRECVSFQQGDGIQETHSFSGVCVLIEQTHFMARMFAEI